MVVIFFPQDFVNIFVMLVFTCYAMCKMSIIKLIYKYVTVTLSRWLGKDFTFVCKCILYYV